MEVLTFILSVLLLDSISLTEAGFFDAFGTIIDRTPVEEPMKAFNPMYQTDTGKEVLDAAFNGNTDISYRRNTWRDPEIHDKNPIVQGFSGITKSDASEGDKTLAKIFPQGVEVLNRLKELNKLKDERNIGFRIRGMEAVSTETNKYVDIDETNQHAGVFRNVPNKYGGVDKNQSNKYVSDRSGPNVVGLDKNVNNSHVDVENEPTNKPTVKKDGDRSPKVLKPLTKKKFYFQVQPVTPENDGKKKDTTETIYYVD